MQIKRHLLHDDAGNQMPFVASPNKRSGGKPRFLIMHYTAGSSAESSITHFTRSSAKASAHLVIGRDGSITQMVAFNQVAWHAGISRWQGISGLNNHSIGIELDNAGELKETSRGWESWFGRIYPEDEVTIAAHKHIGIEAGWHNYTEAQLAAALDVSELLFDHYDLEDILGHDDIAPERKRDPGPAFPMAHFASRLCGRMEDELPLYETTARLNIRQGPGVEFATLREAPLTLGTQLRLELRDASWGYVEVLDSGGEAIATGWVHCDYIRRV